MLDVAREQFVPAARRAIAYLDIDVPVGDKGARALLKPMVLARLLQAAGIREGDRVLDVGCATGYSAAVLARLAAAVVALEEDTALARTAGETLAASGVSNVSVVSGPLHAGFAQDAPYDVIVMEGASEVVPAALLAQLKDGGRLVAVIGSGPMGKATIYRAAGGGATGQTLFDASAPLLPGFAKPAAFVF
jgi:protein-L-isoaspartate(D-aspartate) O-methyltransferase